MKISLNLADRIYINRRALLAGYAVVGTVMLLLLVMNSVFLLNSHRDLADMQERLTLLQDRSAALQGGTGDFSQVAYQQMLSDIEFANSILKKDAFRWTELLNHLETLVPEGVALRSILPDHKNRALNITAVARSLDEMTLLLDQFAQSETLRNVYLLRQEKAKITDLGGREREGVQFSLLVREAF